MAAKKSSLNFEQRIQQLESLVHEMEKGELSLEESLQAFEKGIAITRECQQALSEAEQRIEILNKEAGQLKVEPFEPEQ